MADPLASMLALQGPAMHANDPVKLALLRAQQEDEMRHNLSAVRHSGVPSVTGAEPSDLESLEGDIQDDPYTGEAAQKDAADQDALTKGLFTYNRPDVAAVRKAQLADQEELATAPARMQGEFAVKAAESKAAANNDALTMMLGSGMAPGSRMSAGGNSITSPAVSTHASPDQTANVQYLQALRTGKAHAPGSYFLGIGRADADKAEIARVEALLGGGGSEGQAPAQVGGMIYARDPNGVVHQAPAGTPLRPGFVQVDGPQ